ncbi:MAG: transglutaminase family protein [Betaproteobacteria bacterium]|nr:MAG: transglutaminase family protein [Betaproteobacteria bacterium]
MSDGIRYRVVHETRYRYSSTVTGARQLAHLEPRATAWQEVHSHRIDILPEPVERSAGEDYFGNAVLRFTVTEPHDELLVRAESVVTVRDSLGPLARALPPWEAALASPDAIGKPIDIDVEQYRVASGMAPVLDVAADYARASFAPRRNWLRAMMDLTQRIHEDFTYDATSTTVTTGVAQVFEQRRGVCQDFAHLMLSCLRSLGLPARYVSGYVLNRVPPGRRRLAGADASHAWVAAFCPGHGWIAFDPTNAKLAEIEFVTLGWGRDFSDVTPLRGVVLGAARQELLVAVSVQPI